jgi:CBS domain-containing protein
VALTTMAQHGVRRLPVIDGAGALTRVLAVDDVLGHVTGELGKLVGLLPLQAQQECDRRP